MASKPSNNPVGRPTKYQPDMGPRLIAAMKKGLSLTAACSTIHIIRETAMEWAKIHPEFSEAIKIGKGYRLEKLERDLLMATDGPHVTSRIFALKNADPEEWGQEQRVRNEHLGSIEMKDITPNDLGRRLAFALQLAADKKTDGGEGSD